MADLTLPGDIPGLLRRCSPIICLDPEGDEPRGCRGLVHDIEHSLGFTTLVAGWRVPDGVNSWDREWFYETNANRVALDLQDETGRTHAAWWLLAWLVRTEQDPPPVLTAHERWKSRILVNMAVHRSCDLATLQRVCLRVAGRDDG